MRNGWRKDVHVAPFAYLGVSPDCGLLSANPDEGFLITAVARPRSRVVDLGARPKVASFVRIYDVSMPPRIKASANYHNGRLAIM